MFKVLPPCYPHIVASAPDIFLESSCVLVSQNQIEYLCYLLFQAFRGLVVGQLLLNFVKQPEIDLAYSSNTADGRML